jgi:hypothetical protein
MPLIPFLNVLAKLRSQLASNFNKVGVGDNHNVEAKYTEVKSLAV